jgi:CRISPR-associated protein Cmr4
MTSYLTIVHVLSSLHAGTGQGSGVIDLPIAREKATGLPYLPGSSLKGTLRTRCPEEKREPIFGSEDTAIGASSAGTVQISDQRLLLLPVRSLAGTFAWVTSPYVLRRLKRDLQDLGIEQGMLPEIPTIAAENLQEARISDVEEQCRLVAVKDKGILYLDEFDLIAHPDPYVTQWATWLGHLIFSDKIKHAEWRQALQGQFCIVHDDLFGFLLRTAIEVTARIHLQEESKTVMNGGLWYEESLPAETVLSGLMLTTPRPGKLSAEEIGQELDQLVTRPLQLGGKSTTGRGLCRVSITDMKRGAGNANA